MLKQIALSVVASALLTAAAIAAEPESHHGIVYSAPGGQAQQLDVFVNPAATAEHPAPVLVYIHGGAWAHGERPTRYEGFRRYLAMGFSVVSVDYRLTGVATAPAAVTDTLCALSWVKRNATAYRFDINRVVAYGTSAGGHLAMLSGLLPRDTALADPACGPLPKTAAILDFYGPADLGPGMGPERPFRSLQNWIGKVDDPMALARKLSPIAYVGKDQPPVFIVHGNADPTVPYEQSVALKAALDKAGEANAFHTVEGGLHGKFTDEQQDAIAAEIAAFLKTQGVLR
jgi:acetyl esterase/lipase